MTVSTEVSREEYTGNGVTTDFDYRFRVFSAADLVVSVADTTETISVLTLNTDYTVTGAGSRTGGKVKLMSPLAFNWRINIERALPVTQETDIRNQGNFFPEVHEDAFDKLTMLIQQVWSYFGLALRKPTWLAKFYDAMGNRIANLGSPINPQDAATKSYVDSVTEGNLNKTLRVPESYISPIASIVGRKNKILAFDNSGNPLPVLPESGSAADVMIELSKPDGLKNVGRCHDIATLRTIIPTSLPQRIEVITYRFNAPGWAAQYDPLGGGQFEAAQDSTTVDDGGSFIRVNSSWGWKRVFRGFVTLHDFGADGTLANDELAKNNALVFCGATKLDLQALPGTYYFSTPMLWRSRNHSITSKGNVVFDFTNCPAGTYAVRVVEQAQSEGTIWHGITHSMSGVSLYGKAGVHGVIINQANEYSTPAINIDNCFFNEFDDHITFGNNEWICAFRRCFFRGNSNGTSRFVVVNKNYNACENQRFESCTFGGNQTALAIKHITGSCEFTFDGCSFDYNRGVLQSVNPAARGMWRFKNCHFEDSGAVRNFDIDTGSSTSYIDLIGCDWYFTEDLPSKIGVFKSTNSASTLNIISCKLTIFQETQDRSVVDLFTSDTSAGSRFKINTDANTIEMSSNKYFNVLCAANNLYARFTEANLTSGQFVFNGAGSTVFSNTDYPFDSTKQTWITTGGREAYAWVTYNPNKRLAISGWIRKSTDYYVEVRFFNTEDVVIGTQTLGVPGATGVWSKFGQMIYPPAGTAKIRLGWRFPAGVTAGDTVSVNNWIVEQY